MRLLLLLLLIPLLGVSQTKHPMVKCYHRIERDDDDKIVSYSEYNAFVFFNDGMLLLGENAPKVNYEYKDFPEAFDDGTVVFSIRTRVKYPKIATFVYYKKDGEVALTLGDKFILFTNCEYSRYVEK